MALLEIELPEALLPQPKQIGQFIRRTQSVCPECNRILPATVFAREGKVFMTKTCPEHGETEELYFGSYDMYQKFATYWSDGKGTHAPNVPIESCACPANCGLCSNHLSHTGLANIIVTNRSPSREEGRSKSGRSTGSPYPTASRESRSRLTERSRETRGSQSQAAHQ